MSKPENQVVVHITAKAVYVVIGRMVAPDDIRIRAITHTEIKTNDFVKGKVVSQDRLKKAIKIAIETAEDMSKCRVHSVWLSFSSPEILSTNSYGSVTVMDDTVSVSEVVRTLKQAKDKDMPKDHYLMQHVQQAAYINNEQQAIEDPIGSFADNISVMYHLMMLPVCSRQNIEELFKPLNIRVDYMIFDAISGAEYALIDEEREAGVCFIDIGYGSTSFCMYKDNKLIYTGCMPVGGYEVTLDIAAETGLTIDEAEEFKKRYGSVDKSAFDVNHFKTVSSLIQENQEYTINMHLLASVIEARYSEILNAIHLELQEANLLEFIDKGIVLSGGGSKIKGMVPFTNNFFNMSAVKTTNHAAFSADSDFVNENKYGEISRTLEDPSYYTALGTLLYSQSEQFRRSDGGSEEALKKYNNKTKKWIKSIKDKISAFM